MVSEAKQEREQHAAQAQALAAQLAEARQHVARLEAARKEDDERGAKIKALLVKTKKEVVDVRAQAAERAAAEKSLQEQV